MIRSPVLSQLALRGWEQPVPHAMASWLKMPAEPLAQTASWVVGALYHDIGRLPRPIISSRTSRRQSSRSFGLVERQDHHQSVTFGYMAKEWPAKRVADFIPQHHGTHPALLLRKAEAEANGKKINERDFRYPGPKPQFKEAAILMLVDSAEAAARSLAQPDAKNIRAIVSKIFDAVVTDGQLDDSKLTVQELSLLGETIVNSLIAIYHPRIDYPGFNVPLGSREDTPAHHVTYAEVADVPINPSGEVEEEAVSRTDAPGGVH